MVSGPPDGPQGVRVTVRNERAEIEDLWRLTMEHSPVGMALLSPRGRFLSANVALCDMLGYACDELVELTFQDVTRPDDLADDLRLVERVLAGEIASFRVTKRYVRSDGGTLVGDLSVALLRSEDGEPIHFIAQVLDLTEREAFVERLDEADALVDIERRRAGAVFDTAAVGLLLLDEEGNYLAHNGRYQEFLDQAFPDGHRGGAGQLGFVFDADQARVLGTQERLSVRAAAGEEFDEQLVWIGEDPMTRRALSVTARNVLARDGAFIGAALAFHDVTAMMRAVSVKEEFVSSISHELRTPLTAALAYLELLEESGDLSVDVHTQVSAVRRNVRRLSLLVADLIYAAQANSGSPLIAPYRLDLVPLVADALGSAAVEADGSRVTLAGRMPESLDVVADGLRLRHVLDNVLTHAIVSAGRDGRVDVTLVATGTHAELTVSDDGAGVEETGASEVFDLFARGTHGLGVAGTGLGLDIVRTIVEAHGGEVSVHSAPGVGTTVRVVLPR